MERVLSKHKEISFKKERIFSQMSKRDKLYSFFII